MRNANEQGLTLIEIVVVLVIIGTIMAFLGPKVFQAGASAKQDLTKISMESLRQNIAMFQLRYNTLPSSLTDLTRCTEVTGPGCAPITDEKALRDAWGGNFTYTLSGDGRTYRLQSLGADSRPGGEGVDFDIYIDGP